MNPLGQYLCSGESGGKGMRAVWRGSENSTVSPVLVLMDARMTVSVRAPKVSLRVLPESPPSSSTLRRGLSAHGSRVSMNGRCDALEVPPPEGSTSRTSVPVSYSMRAP